MRRLTTKKFWGTFGLVLLLTFFLGTVCFAGADTSLDVKAGTEGLTNQVSTIADSFATAVRGIFGVLVAAFVIWGGVLMLTAAGDSQKVAQGKDKFKYALGSLIVVFLADKIVGFVIGMLGGNG